MLKDLNQEAQAPEKCSGCGAPIRDRLVTTLSKGIKTLSPSINNFFLSQLLPLNGRSSVACELSTMLSMFAEFRHRVELLLS